MARAGLSFYTIDTDRYQDKRIKRLKKNCGCAGLAVYDYILCEIYRVQGCVLVWDEDTAFDVAEYLGLKENTVSEIVQYCGVVGLFDKELLSGGIVTSASIQRRYLDMCRRAKRANVAIPEKYAIIREELPKITEELQKNTEDSQQSKIKKSIIKENNSLSISLSLAESENERSGVTAAERERIFEILFFDKNCKNPDAEVNALIGYYTANGWRRSNGAPIHDRTAVASTWAPEDKAPRIPTLLLDWLNLLHTKAKKENSADASAIIHGIYGAKVGFKGGRTHFTVSTTPEARAAMERHILPSERFSLTISTVNG